MTASNTQSAPGSGPQVAQAKGSLTQVERSFIRTLGALDVAVFPARPNDSDPNKEFDLPRWRQLTSTNNLKRLRLGQPGQGVAGVLSAKVAVVDVDVKNGANIEQVVEWLKVSDVEVYAEIETPSGGRHFYVAGHPDLPNVAAREDRDGLKGLPGVEILSMGRLAYLPGSSRPKYDGRGYAILSDSLARLVKDPDSYSAERLVQAVADRRLTPRAGEWRAQPPAPPWDGTRPDPRQAAYLAKALAGEVEILTSTASGGRNNALNLAAIKMGSYISGAGLNRDEVVEALLDACIDNGLLEDDGEGSCRATIASGFRIGEVHPKAVPAQDGVGEFTDSRLAERLYDQGFGRSHCWVDGLGWHEWDGARWLECSDVPVIEAVRKHFREWMADEVRSGASDERRRSLNSIQSRARITAVSTLMRGLLSRPADQFDRHPDLLNVRNGVVDLQTGKLRPHDPDLLFTKITGADYDPSTTHPDWLAAKQALPAHVAAYWLRRLGQAITGYPSPDDKIVVQRGDGENGKSTLVDAIAAALGDYAVQVPRSLLIGNSREHRTDFMTLRGARLAYIEELPEAGRLDVTRLKEVAGTSKITARKMNRDYVEFPATHSLIVDTNYQPIVTETDHGTWRRLELVQFPYTFRKPGGELHSDTDREGDPTLRDRVRSDPAVHRAALAELVSNAVAWYEAGRNLPAPPVTVVQDTEKWRGEADAVLGYFTERLVADDTSHINVGVLVSDFDNWLTERHQPSWGTPKMTSRFEGHDPLPGGVKMRRSKVRPNKKNTPSTPSGAFLGVTGKQQYWAWQGVRFRNENDDHDD